MGGVEGGVEGAELGFEVRDFRVQGCEVGILFEFGW